MSQDILVHTAEKIATVTLNQPEKLNAMTPAMMGRLREIMAGLETDPEVRVIVFTGAGNGFSAGGDRDFLGDVTRMTPFEIKKAVYENFQGATKAVKLCPKPTIAAVNGAAVGAGCELAVACDFRIAADTAFFLESWVHLGVIAPLGGMFLLPQLVGLGKATEMLMLGTRVDAKEAERIGLVNRTVPGEQLMDAAMEMARQLAAGPPLALSVFKEGLRRGMESTLAAEWDFNLYAQSMLLNSEDFAESVAAMAEKRTPNFTGK